MATQRNIHPSVNEQLSELLLRWQELCQQGQNLTAEVLCADCPELVEELKQRLQAIASMEAMLGVGEETVTNREAAGPECSTPRLAAEPEATAGPRAVADRWHIPGYQVLDLLGQGGMGIVYKARQVKLDRLVAIKMLPAGPHARPEQLARFRSEAEAVAQLRHPNIVQIYDVGEWQGQPYFSMEFMEGGSLAQKLSKTVLPAHQAAEFIATLAEAIDAAHQRGIIHRDLKPANVLLAVSDQRSAVAEESRSVGLTADRCLLNAIPKITDFGLAKWISSPERQPDEVSLTQSGTILGTPCYLAPEQAQGRTRQIGPATDVYALGAILYETLTGRPPFQGETTLDILEQVRCQEPVPPSRLQPKVARDLETICLKCLHKEPRKRYGSGAALADDLRRFLAGEPIQARPTPLWERAVKWARRKPALAALFAVSGVAAAALLAGWISFTAELHAERDHARKEQQRALEQERIAKNERDHARKEQQRALEQEQIAKNERDHARREQQRALEQEQIATNSQRLADEQRAAAQRERDAANTQRDRAQRILNRMLTAIDQHAQITEMSKERRVTLEPGSLLYELARAYAVASVSYHKDTELPLEDRTRLAEQYAARAVKLLEHARATGYFNRSGGHLMKLKNDKDLDPLRTRPDFKKLVAEVQGQARME